jgi:hypothetical protein
MNIALVICYFMLSYIVIGLVYAARYMVKSMGARDEDTIQTSARVKTIFIPGLVLTWPITILHWRKPIERYSNHVQPLQSNHLRIWIILSIVLPILSILALIHIQPEAIDQPVREHPDSLYQPILISKTAQEYTVNLRGIYPDSLQVEVLATQGKPHANQTVILNVDHHSYVLGLVASNHPNLFSLPQGMLPGRFNISVEDKIKHLLLCEITF